MKHILFWSILTVIVSGCDRPSGESNAEKANLDSAKLESVLSGGQIDRIEVITLKRTNILTGVAAQQYAFSLRATNRIAEPDTTKDPVATEVGLMSGTNELGSLCQFDNGLWKYGAYSFLLKTSP